MKELKMLGMIIAITLTAVACKKRSETPAPETSSPGKNFSEVSYFYEGVLDDKYTLQYDPSGRLTSMKTMNYTDALEYISASKLKVTRRSLADNSILRTYEGDLNASGAIVLLTAKDKNGTLIETTTLSYNSEGYLAGYLTQTASSSFGRAYIIENGKLKTGKVFYNGVQNGNFVYTSDETKENRQYITVWGLWYSPDLFGKRLKFLPSEYIGYYNNGNVQSRTKSSYERDAQGHLMKENIDYITEGKKGYTVYKY
ncbi:hypothetical protein [Niabella drilacis]|uniref:Uncharacterized protein n=1 Tax=Niabella drilacis (strain DSM 25811 / CCM 8410 / CCUG 62505 / LMG 26954 / E90) TaxID=1285928 RepID=A0A1G6SI41_NIADE|nr:hypothetical protein [Niabella drilacis]SDD15816.1 hypothetical protein SAMN04487894_106216 [Niabella drilacis]